MLVARSTKTPVLIEVGGPRTKERFWEFFTVNIRNPNTRIAYYHAVSKFFEWCQARHLVLETIRPMMVAAYIEQHPGAPPTIKQHLAAIRMLFDWLVVGQVMPANPATSVRGPKHVVKEGKTHVLNAVQARCFIDSIETDTVMGLRDRALIGVMVYSFARVSAAVQMRVCDYFHLGRESFLRLHEKGGKLHKIPAHVTAQRYLDDYLERANITEDLNGPLFRTMRAPRDVDRLSSKSMSRMTAIDMVKRRGAKAGFAQLTCHSFRGTGITAYLKHGGTLEHAARIAGHESTRTTQLYNRILDDISREEIARIII